MFAGMKFAIGVVSERIFIIYTTPVGYLSLSTVISIQKLLNTICPRVSKKGAQTTTTRRNEKKSGTHTQTEREREERDVIRPRATDAFPFEPTAGSFPVVFGEKKMLKP
jgi:hypothetical protein